MSEATPLQAELRRMIEAEGPMPVARYMALCLSHPQYGYYRTRDPLGAAGDFTTAPEISQMFGELLGLWAAAVWQLMGSPPGLSLVELGPGRGTLMADALRAATLVPAFRDAAAVHFVETSPVLRERQRWTLASAASQPTWHDDIDTLPRSPIIAIANEFFDALPIHQAVKTAAGWRERLVGLDARGALAFGLSPTPLPGFQQRLPHRLHDAPDGAIYEWRPPHQFEEIFGRVAGIGGAALIVDYGHVQSGFGDTLQAVRRHGFCDPLNAPGEADLTAHVDFEALADTAHRMGARVHGPATQGDFLRRLGIETRAARLKAAATPAQAEAIDGALQRLTGDGASQMGALFKVMAVAHPALAALPGFDS